MGKSFQFMLVLLVIAMLVCLALYIIAAIGALNLTNGCFMRYSVDEYGNYSNNDSVSNTSTLKANGNYSFVEHTNGNGFQVDETAYGKWLNSNFNVTGGQIVKFTIRGEVSLCQSYVPINNLQDVSATDFNGKKIAIPRLDDKNSAPVGLPMDAKLGEWRNLAEIFPNDHYVVSIMPDQKTSLPSVSMKNWIEGGLFTADCREGKIEYSPICGRFTFWTGQNYVDKCVWDPACSECNNCHNVCDTLDAFGTCMSGWYNVCNACGCYVKSMSLAPEPYLFNGFYTSPWRAEVGYMFPNFQPSCSNDNHLVVNGSYQTQKYFWFSADNAAGLLYRMDNSIIPTNRTVRGANYQVAAISADQSFYNNGEKYKILLNETHTGSNISYLQFKIADKDDRWSDNTGGYVLNIKHTKCRRANGEGIDDTLENRGIVEYAFMPYGQDPNNPSATISPNIIVADADGNGQITVPSSSDGYLWLKIKNKPEDYKDSTGQYQVQFFAEITKGNFFEDILNPIFETLKTKIMDASQTIFKNMICYRGIGSSGADQSNCVNFFNYIKGLLTLYIMGYGFMFLLGIVKISQTDLVIRVIKIGLVAGLMNENTFDFFNNYVFNLVTGFSDSIISNMSGYTLFTSTNANITNPFTFLTAIMTKIFFSKTFAAQMMAMIAMGINGVLYFIITFITLIMLIIVSFRAVAVYLMAFVAIAVLIGLAPLFLTFMLFEFTFYLFDNWIKFTFRYMIEPVIMMAGIIILTQLFTIYLDYVTGYSVCWKCALPIQIPFPDIPGFNPAFLNVPLFCINWFAPWGFDHFSGVMGINIQHIVALMIIAYCLWGYVEFAGKITGRLAGAVGGPSATEMGGKMSGAIEQKSLKKMGLDAQSRAQMKSQFKQGLNNPSQSNNPNKEDRHDVKPHSSGNLGEGKVDKATSGASAAPQVSTPVAPPAAKNWQSASPSGGTARSPTSQNAVGPQSGSSTSGEGASPNTGTGNVPKPISSQDTGSQVSSSATGGGGSPNTVKDAASKPTSSQGAGSQPSTLSTGGGAGAKANSALEQKSSYQFLANQRARSIGGASKPGDKQVVGNDSNSNNTKDPLATRQPVVPSSDGNIKNPLPPKDVNTKLDKEPGSKNLSSSINQGSSNDVNNTNPQEGKSDIPGGPKHKAPTPNNAQPSTDSDAKAKKDDLNKNNPLIDKKDGK